MPQNRPGIYKHVYYNGITGDFLTVKVIIYSVYSKDLGHSFQLNVHNMGGKKNIFKCADSSLGDSSQSKNSKLFSGTFAVFFSVSVLGRSRFYPFLSKSCME